MMPVVRRMPASEKADGRTHSPIICPLRGLAQRQETVQDATRERPTAKICTLVDLMVEGNGKDISPAMAWGSSRHTLVETGTGGGSRTTLLGVDNGIWSNKTLMLMDEESLLPARRVTQLHESEAFLSDKIIYHPYSHVALATVDLSIWQDQLSTETIKDLLRRNHDFSKLILRGLRRKSAEILPLITQNFGNFVEEIDVSDSLVVNDSWLRAFGVECPAMTRLTAARCGKITNHGVEIIAQKKRGALRALNVACCDKVSDDGVEILAKYCTKLQSVDLSGCPRVRDRSVYAMSKLIGLRTIALDGCAEVTDEAFVKLVISTTELHSLSLKRCSSITEGGLRFMRVLPVPWGMRKHRNCSELKTLRVGQNNNISDEFIIMVAVLCPKLRTLEVNTCPLVGGDEAMGSLGDLLELVDVSLEVLPRVSDEGVRRFFGDSPRRTLKVLSLVGCTKVTDVSLKYIAKNARGLWQLRLDRNVSVTDRGLGYLAKGPTALKLLHATHLGMVTDEGVRLVARKCLGLTDLDCSHCLRLTVACLPMIRRLRSLEILGISGCRNLVRDGGDGKVYSRTVGSTPLDAAQFHNLREIRLSQNPYLTDGALQAVAKRNCRTIKTLDISYCSGVTAAGVIEALKVLLVLERLDLTGCELIRAVDVEDIARYVEQRLLLSCARRDLHGFDGLYCSASCRDARARRELIFSAYQEELAAQTIQSYFQRYRQREEENTEALRRYHERMWAATIIQGLARRFLAQQELSGRYMRRARLMLRVFKWHKRTQEILVWKSASRHGDRVLLRHVVRNWRVSVVKKLADSSDLVGRAERFFELTLMRTHLRAWGRFRSPSRAEEELKGVRAYEWWCERSRAALFRQWRDNIRKNITRRLKMVEMLLFILPIEFQNSSRQKPKVEFAVTFHRRRALRKAWTAFLGLKTELMELQQRFKIYEERNRPRVLRRNFVRLYEAVAIQQRNRRDKLKVDATVVVSRQRRGLRSLSAAAAAAASFRASLIRAETFSKKTFMTIVVRTLSKNHKKTKVLSAFKKLWQERAVWHYTKVLRRKGLRLMADRMRQRAKTTVAMAKAISKFMAVTTKMCFMVWKLEYCTLKNAAGTVQTREARELLTGAFDAWAELSVLPRLKPSRSGDHDSDLSALDKVFGEEGQLTVDEDMTSPLAPEAQVPDQTSDASIASVVEPEAEVESECEVVTAVEVEYPPEMNPAAVVIQTTWRGFMTRKRYVEEKTTRQWVAIKVQSLFRAIKARRVFAKHARYKRIREMVKADKEEEVMAVADKDSHRLREYYKALDTLGKIIWGYRGRKLARRRKREARLEEATKRSAMKQEALRRYEETQKRLAMLRRGEEKSATLIQAVWRSKVARATADAIREENRQRRAAVMIQGMIRFRAARHDAAARNRHRGRTVDAHRRRRGQARLLRIAGLKHRGSQRVAIRLLRKAGMDLAGFTVSLKMQKMDLVRDFRLARKELGIQIEAFRVGGLLASRRRNYIRARQLDDLERNRVRRGDAVKILDREHEFCGFTGRVLRVDFQSLGQEVAVVKLDDGTRRIAYVRLLTRVEEENGIPRVNMLKIHRREIARHSPAEIALVSDALLAWADRERSWWRSHRAAVVIQRRIRGYLARRSTARRRYRYWTNQRVFRLVFLRGLDVANIATCQTVRDSVRLRVIKPNMVPTNMPLIPPVPPRLGKVFKQRRRRIILEKELRTRMAARARAIDRGISKLRWKTPTHGPLMRRHHLYEEVRARLFLFFVHRSSMSTDVSHPPMGRSFEETLDLKAEARAVYTRGFRFVQLEKSPHVRAGGCAMFHGSWTHPKSPSSENSRSPLSSDDGLGNGTGDGSRYCGQGETENAEVEGRGKGLIHRRRSRGIISSGGRQVKISKVKQLQFSLVLANLRRGDAGCGEGAIKKHEADLKHKTDSTSDKKLKRKKQRKEKKRQKKSIWVASVPHGEGYVEFLNGWGISQEEKTLYVTVVGAKFLKAKDRSLLAQHCYPFFLIKCNGRTQRTSTRYNIREPRYNEMFEFDVTDPSLTLTLECWEEGVLSDAYLGNVTLPLKNLSDGNKIRNWYPLTSADFRKESKMNPVKGALKGSVDLELQWLPKEIEDDVDTRIRLSKSAVVLQCWARTIEARRVAADATNEARLKANYAFVTTLRIQTCWRGHIARRELRIRKMRHRNACILQKFSRRKLVYMEAILKRSIKDRVIRIQCFVRQRFARDALARLSEERRTLEKNMATRVQANARGKLTRTRVAAMRQATTLEQVAEGTQQAKGAVPVAEWLPLYGRDHYYASKRVRRVTERAYYKILGTSGSILESRLGTAMVLRYPARVCPPGHGLKDGTTLRDEKRFVEVEWNAYADLRWAREEREATMKKAPRCYRGFFELGSVPADRTVDRRAIMIQCLARIRRARKAFSFRRRRRDAANVIQIAYRQYCKRKVDASRKIQSIIRRRIARREGDRLAREKRCAIAIQCAHRSYKARLEAAYKRVIRTTKVTGSSGSAGPLYGPERCVVLDPSEESTMWCSPYGQVEGQWIAFDLGKDYPVGALRLLAMSNTTCPKMVQVECCKTGKQAKYGPWSFAGSFRVANQPVWQHFQIPRMLDGTTISRRWKVIFVSNYGNTTAVAVHGIQFLLAKEESPRVLSQWHSTVVTPPPVGKGSWTLSLGVDGTAWPPHQYQWYRNGQPIEGERWSKLEIRIFSPPTRECRAFRCLHCKRIKENVPRNAARVVCGNCETPYTFEEYQDVCISRSKWEQEVTTLESAVETAERVADKAVVDRDKARLEAFLCEHEGKAKLSVAKEDLRNKEAALVEAKEWLSAAREVVNEKHRELLETAHTDPLKVRHDFEGVYECRLSNTRGGSIVRAVSSYAIYVSARNPPPLRLEVKVNYVPKKRMRRRYWPKYAWAFGWFTNGKIGGDILIRYHDEAIYDGPYIPELCLDIKGGTPQEAREPGHWGRWITKSGLMYEGPLVDNHFDVDCIIGLYRMTTPVGEVYEGEWLDEKKHGTGEYRYVDGTLYTGEWYRGQRQGFGTLVAPDGSSYEGEFHHDLIHGEGLWSWPDGSSYAGRASHGSREGIGLYVTDMRDSFYGEFQENKPHGEGVLRCCDGSSYIGGFEAGKRHGRGTLEDAARVHAIGTWNVDKRNGVFELRTPVFIPEFQQTQDEIRTGLWEEGEFVEWLSPPIYPYATMKFCEMFEKDDSEYDGVYAMLVAKKLPNLPRGVDPKNPRVMACARRIAAEAGELCASDSIEEAKKQIAEWEIPHSAALAKLQVAESLEHVCRQQCLEKKETVESVAKKLAALVENRDELEMQVEQFYADDQDKTRELFLQAVARLKTIPRADWFVVRNYEKPPPVLAALMSAVCTLMLVRDTWKSARSLVGSSSQNMKEGDEEAMYTKYDCKLVHRLENEFSPYTRCDANDVMFKLAKFVVDPRFEGGSLFLRVYGEALGPIADTVRTAYKYIVKASKIKPRKMAIAGVEVNIKHTSMCLERERGELEELDKQMQETFSRKEEAEVTEAKARVRLEKARAMLKEAQDLVTVYVPPRKKLDPYERLETNLDPEMTEVEVVLELLVLQTEARLRNTTTEVAPFEVESFLATQTGERIVALVKEGVYTLSAGTVKCHDDAKIVRSKSSVINECKNGINACLNDAPPEKGEWTLLRGRIVRESSLKQVLDTKWDESLRERALKEAVENWALAFPGEGEAAYQALMSASNEAVSDERKAEAKLWLDNNADAVEDMTWHLATQFAEGWPYNTVEGCIQVLDGNDYGPDVRLKAKAWEKLHHDAIRKYRAEALERLAADFSVMWESDAEAARQVIAIREAHDEYNGAYAEAWASFHLVEIAAAEEKLAKSRSTSFEDRYPEGTAAEAIRILAPHWGEAVSAYDSEETREAFSWCALHSRAATGAEEKFMAKLAEDDAKAAVEQEALERRLERLRDRKSGEEVLADDATLPGGALAPTTGGTKSISAKGADASESVGAVATSFDDGNGVDKGKPRADIGVAAVVDKGGKPTSPGNRKAKKKSPGVKKSKAQKLAEKREAEEMAKREEKERKRLDEEATQEALRARPKSKDEQVTELLAAKLAERLKSCGELVALLRRAKEKAEGDDSPARALRDPILRPSERKAKHDALLEQRRKNLGGIEARIAEAETKAERLGARLEATGVVFDSFGEAAALSASGVGEGWVSYLDEESGQYYWYNDLTGEAYYD